MADVEFKIGNVVELKSTLSGYHPQFVVSDIIGNELEVVWFNTDTKEFNKASLSKDVFRIAY
ncbi:hypothetical protein [Empedobacter sedimenti]|uniref:hypothetical protein n=1 Tax=Empedobacter sedimenti TaxID=3042610 RepID=UPI0024A784AD|nr:hypothetical protein [Empedobacter sedimenti]